MKKLHILSLACTFLLSSCSLLPIEEEPQRPPVITQGAGREYAVVQVMRGEIEQTKIVNASYRAALREELVFKAVNRRVKSMYVSLGDYVEAGDLLAELDNNDIISGIADCESTIERLGIQRKHIAQDEATAKKRLSLLPEGEYAAALRAHNESYAAQYSDIDTRLQIEQLRQADLQQRLEKHTLRAGISGNVIYVKQYAESDTTNEDEIAIIITDKETSAFIVKDSDKSLFAVGDRVQLTYKRELYPAAVIAPEELAATIDAAFIKTDEPILDVEEGASASIVVTLERRDDALYLPLNCVKQVQGMSVVYQEADDTLQMKEVVTGIANNSIIEIVDGLDEGEEVVLQ